MGQLLGKSILVTGAGQGIGEAVARFVAAEDAAVAVNDIDSALAEAVAADIVSAGGRAVAVAADLGDEVAAGVCVDACVEHFGRIDGLVNNAGLLWLGPPEALTGPELDRMFRANVASMVFCSVRAFSHMRGSGGGAIVNMTSGAQLGYPNISGYAVTKGAVSALTYSHAVDFSTGEVRVNAVSPAASTRMTSMAEDRYDANDERRPVVVAPECNAPIVGFLLSDAAKGVTGQVFRSEGERLALVSRSSEIEPGESRPAWSIDDVSEAVLTRFAPAFYPAGATRARVELVSPSIQRRPERTSQ